MARRNEHPTADEGGQGPPESQKTAPAPEAEKVVGVLDLNGRGGGFLRDPAAGYAIRPSDVSVSAALCRTLCLRGGETICGWTRPSSRSSRDRRLELVKVESIDDILVEERIPVTPFEQLTAIDPNARLRFSTTSGSTSMRVVDLMTPIGLGQRGLIVAPPRTGKTILLEQMADGIATNHPEVHLMVLLVDERPEEVTHIRRSVRGEVVASSNDQSVDNHIRIAHLVIARAKRLVEQGKDVAILLDSLTRLGRAFNTHIRGTGRIMSGGLDIGALREPKAIFGAARNAEDGGSLTIIASALIETGSRMDDVIFNEFKGTGNMEIMLSRAMADRRIWPAIDLEASGTRKEELLLPPAELAASHQVRRKLIGADPIRSMETLVGELGKHPSNEAFAQNFVEAPRSGRRRFS